MKFYCIPPNNHLELMDEGDRYFCLAHHYIQNEKYKKRFLALRSQSPKVWITLDNSAAEHSLVTEDVLLSIVGELKPDEAIAPDVLFNKEETIKNFKSFVSKMYNKGFLSHTSIFACPQGSTKEEWLQCYLEMAASPFVRCIGLSKIAVPKCWNNAEGDTMIGVSRNQCIQELDKKSWLGKPIHLLGMGEHNEFDYYLKHKTPCIRSSDSCYSVLAALNGIDFEQGDLTRVPTTNEYFEATLTEAQIQLAKKNVKYLKTKYSSI